MYDRLYLFSPSIDSVSSKVAYKSAPRNGGQRLYHTLTQARKRSEDASRSVSSLTCSPFLPNKTHLNIGQRILETAVERALVGKRNGTGDASPLPVLVIRSANSHVPRAFLLALILHREDRSGSSSFFPKFLRKD
ncbi:uncharacterized protein BDZ83DRAFT_606313 [Colletotrichum acutatum]|uniref:Uncharacterized protein n=1 Tax=Glomerella acutata TaxID=27357 RepID=A0AAD8XL35_GLOAC|nr:uncharacterized protein BDZ83DRAFT_606313 [Colletotrichum acutatum]KAK1729365.1 hypothetical protein BDZ83DRAFT_606313 [Colletotrichum acutatum]